MDTRQLDVTLTDAGKHVLQRAVDALMESGAADLLVGSALTERWWHEPSYDEAERNVRRALGKIRDAFHDRAALGYPASRRAPHPQYWPIDWFAFSSWGCDKGRFRKPRPYPNLEEEDDIYDSRRDLDGVLRPKKQHRDYGLVYDQRAAFGWD